MAFDTFLQIDTVTGEATATSFAGQIEIASFSIGANNSVTVGSGTTGIAGGKASVSSFSFTKRLDLSSNVLWNACVSGTHFKSALVSLRKAGGTDKNPQQVYLTYAFTDVMIDSFQWSGSGGGDDTHTESVSMAYAGVVITYKPQKTVDGTEGSQIVGSWDVTTVAKTS